VPPATTAFLQKNITVKPENIEIFFSEQSCRH